MTYRVIVNREDGGWLVDIPDAAGAFTESEDLPSLDQYCREVAALALDLPDEAMPGFEFEWVLEVTDDDLVDAIAQQRGVPRTDVLARGWSLADVAGLLNAPVERVTHVPPPAANARVAR
jgi:predicted RNase H-like HicB family nuclease